MHFSRPMALQPSHQQFSRPIKLLAVPLHFNRPNALQPSHRYFKFKFLFCKKILSKNNRQVVNFKFRARVKFTPPFQCDRLVEQIILKNFSKCLRTNVQKIFFAKFLRKIHSNTKWSHGGGALDSYPTFKIQSVGIYRIQINN